MIRGLIYGACQAFKNRGQYVIMGEKYLESKGADQIMNFTEIRELYKNREAYLDQKVTVGGWIRSIRDSKTFGFIVVNDGTIF